MTKRQKSAIAILVIMIVDWLWNTYNPQHPIPKDVRDQAILVAKLLIEGTLLYIVVHVATATAP
jgi:hypothetical protein